MSENETLAHPGNKTPGLPGDRKPLFTIYLNHRCTDMVAFTSERAVQVLIDRLNYPSEGKIEYTKPDHEAQLNDMVAEGTINGLQVHVIFEEWIVTEDGGVDGAKVSDHNYVH